MAHRTVIAFETVSSCSAGGSWGTGSIGDLLVAMRRFHGHLLRCMTAKRHRYRCGRLKRQPERDKDQQATLEATHGGFIVGTEQSDCKKGIRFPKHLVDRQRDTNVLWEFRPPTAILNGHN